MDFSLSAILRCGLLLLILGLTACEEDLVEEPELPSQRILLSYEQVDELENDPLILLASLYSPGLDLEAIQYDAEIYKMEYLTTYQGEEITASGLVCVPSDARTTPFPMLLGFHATISSQREAPSNYTPLNNSSIEPLATLGYITVIPDYIGFGSSADLLHPFFVRETVTRSSTDMLRAAAAMMDELEQAYAEELVLAGYSQGAYNAMATLYTLENDTILSEWELLAAACGGGAYDLPALTQAILSEDRYSSPELLSYLIFAYHEHYQLDGKLDQYFQPPYDQLIPDLYDGSLDLGAIRGRLTNNLTLLLQDQFLEELRTADSSLLEAKLVENSIPVWPVATPVHFFHAPLDQVISEAQTLNLYQSLQQAGAPEIMYTPLEEANSHQDAGLPMIINTVRWLISIRAVQQ